MELIPKMPTAAFLAALTAAAWAGHAPEALAHPHEPVSLRAAPPSRGGLRASARSPLIAGTGERTWQYDPSRLLLPPGVKMKHAHGLARGPDGSLYLNFEAEEVTPTTQTLIRFSPDGRRAVLIGDPALSPGVPHGLEVFVGKDGRPYLLHANNQQTVFKTDLEGRILWKRTWGPEMGNYKPTDTAVHPEGQIVFVTDGYGSSMVHALTMKDGVYAGLSFGGKGEVHGSFKTPHGIGYDPRRNLLVVADRGNSRLQLHDLGGRYQSTVTHERMLRPCTVDVWKDHLLVANLDGPVTVIDGANQVVAVLEVGKLLAEQQHLHPHDAIFTEAGDIVVATWKPGRLSYWRRLPARSKTARVTR